MEKIVLNQYQLTDQDVEYSVDRVKALIVNNSNKIMLCKVNGCFSFVGGHVEGGESLEDCLSREVLEETGIAIKSADAAPLFQLVKYDKDYFSTKKPVKSTITYFAVNTNKKVNVLAQRLDDKEKKNNFQLMCVDLNDVERVLISDEGFMKKPELYEEMLYAIQKYKLAQKESESQNLMPQV